MLALWDGRFYTARSSDDRIGHRFYLGGSAFGLAVGWLITWWLAEFLRIQLRIGEKEEMMAPLGRRTRAARCRAAKLGQLPTASLQSRDRYP